MARGATVRFKPNPGFEGEITRETVEVPRRAAREAQSSAIASAPRGPTGRYAESIKVQDDPDGAILYTDDRAGHLVEWGSVNNRAYRILSNAALQTGGRVDLL